MSTDATFAAAGNTPDFALRASVSWHAGADGPHEEISALLDVTPCGATLTLSEPPELGKLLCLQLPGARRQSQGMRMWALVWAVVQSAEARGEAGPRHTVSVIFVNDAPGAVREGESSVYSYMIEQDGRLRLQRQQGLAAAMQRRRESRMNVPLDAVLEVIGGDGAVLMREQTVTENISRGGAAVWTSLLIGVKQTVRLKSERCGVALKAVVRARRIGVDGVARLHLEFTDGEWPLEKIS